MTEAADLWTTHQKIVVHLVGALSGSQYAAAYPAESWSVRRHLAHLQDVRVRWLAETDPVAAEPLSRYEDDPDHLPTVGELAAALGTSSDALTVVLSRPGRPVSGFPGSAVVFAGYLIGHEANHLGQIEKILDLAGLPLGRDLGMALWRGWWDEDFQRTL